MRREQTGEHLIVRAPALGGVLHGLIQICRELGVSVTDVFQRRTDRLPGSELGERARYTSVRRPAPGQTNE